MSETPRIPTQPTAEQCSAHASLGDGWYAIWYPQMGGYAGKAAVFSGDPNGCVEIAVWHDGEFPFDGSAGDQPRLLHLCDMGQFRQFADAVEALQDAMRKDASK